MRHVNCAPPHEERLQHNGHKGDHKMTPKTWAIKGERGPMIVVWMWAPSVEKHLPPMKTRNHEGKAMSIG